MPKSLDLDRLRRFEPVTPTGKDSRDAPAPPREPVDTADQRWPSREPVLDGQISIKGPLATIRRFKALCKSDRRTYADMLTILMDNFEHRS
jgi:hypothetical protein